MRKRGRKSMDVGCWESMWGGGWEELEEIRLNEKNQFKNFKVSIK